MAASAEPNPRRASRSLSTATSAPYGSTSSSGLKKRPAAGRMPSVSKSAASAWATAAFSASCPSIVTLSEDSWVPASASSVVDAARRSAMFIGETRVGETPPLSRH